MRTTGNSGNADQSFPGDDGKTPKLIPFTSVADLALDKSGPALQNKSDCRIKKMADVSRRDFDNYYLGSEVAVALEILEVWEYKKSFTLSELTRQFKGFLVPQSYRNLKEEYNQLRTIKRLAYSVELALVA